NSNYISFLSSAKPIRDAPPFPYTTLFRSERRAVIKRAISTLPDRYRAPLVLRDVEGKSYDEIASILQTSEGTVKSRINRARNFRSEEHTSELQSRGQLVCRLLLEKRNQEE